ncbi:Membrane bound O-acyl transferase family [Teratosphaeria destructans]|uniref:Membrane bound O-acyl transferase family n=1 Tax=Teratosphaeria destructans TaxID=418781 RepID=A0A9W7SU67_9PEZI|nr:Membrane bound O-acyl transferase family [Teratosphaeria destructans]
MHPILRVWDAAVAFVTSDAPRPGLHPIPGTKPIHIEALILPPVIYYIALLFLPPPPPQAVNTWAVTGLRNGLAVVAGLLFFRMPLAYHIPQSIGLNYQLSLVGLYGGCRVLDAFFISPILFHHIPRRVRYEHRPRVETPGPAPGVKTSANTSKKRTDESSTDSYWERLPAMPLDSYFPATAAAASNAADTAKDALSKTITGPSKQAVYQFETPEDGWPHTFTDRASWALELEMSMRGMGFTWTTADVRHTRKTWLPTVPNRLHSILVHVLPVMLACRALIRYTHDTHLAPPGDPPPFSGPSRFDTRLGLGMQLALTAALGAFLMVAFSLAHSLFAIACSPLAPSPFAFFPPLYTTPIWDITSVRTFWSHGWHRLFARLFLVYGVWPGERIERTLTGKPPDQRADLGKVLGGFLSSALVHAFSVRSVLAGDWGRARGEAIFFVSNGLAVVAEEAVIRAVQARRKRAGVPREMWYDAWIGRAWWIAVLLFSGRNVARGWVDAGLVREMAGR